MHTQYTQYAFIFCLLCIYGLSSVLGQQCGCCCKNDIPSIGCKRSCNDCDRIEEECNSGTDDSNITVIVVSCGVVIVLIAILITICYWIRQSHKRDKRSKHPTVKHDVQSGGIEIEDGGRVSNQPLPTIPVANHYTPEQSLNNTYEQIDPGYSSLKRNAQKPEYATLGQTSDDISKKETSEKANGVDDVSKMYANVEKNRAKENSKLNTDGKGNDTVLSTTGGDSEISSRQQEDAYSKLNRNSYNDSVDDENSTYDKLTTTPTAGDESEDCYSHLNRTSRNLEEDNPDYSKLEPVNGNTNDGYEETVPNRTSRNLEKDNPVYSKLEPVKGNTNDGYEETIPNLGQPPQEKEDRQCEPGLDQINYENGLEGGKENGGYEVANISNSGK